MKKKVFKNIKTAKSRGEQVVGKIDGSRKGFAFLLCEKGDLFIPRDKLKGARHGDTVRVVKTAADSAEVVEILQRGSNYIVGTYYESRGRGYILPDNNHFADVPVKLNAAKIGEKVVAAFKLDGKGQVIEILGDKDDDGIDIKSIIRAYGLFERFPCGVLRATEQLKAPTEADFVGREDYRKELVFTIDGEDSRDFDDAVSIKKTAAGYILRVHIADVSHYVAADSAIDKEAYSRGTSVYFPFAVLPMLPPKLSDDLCSLKEGEDRLTLSVTLHIDKTGEVTDFKIGEGIINSYARLTYTKAAAIIDGGGEQDKQHKQLALPLKHMHDLCILLVAKRKQRGAIDFITDEPKITMDGNDVTNVKKAERLISHRIIEEFMILANMAVAQKFFEASVPFVYRTHASPSENKIERLTEFLNTLGLDFKFKSDSPTPHDFADFLQSVPENLAGVVNQMTLRSMTKAVYEPLCKGHYGLSLKYYCHFTSPIRRYPDLLIHRIIKSFLHGQPLKKYKGIVYDASKESSLRERLAEEAERRVDDLLIAKYMSKFIGESFVGIISGITEWGIFVKLDNTAEGLIRTESLKGQYTFDERSMTLSGQNIYRLGQKIDIILKEVTGDRIEFAAI